MYLCHSCGQAVRGAPAGVMRHNGVCTCLFCEFCGEAIGDEMEEEAWNATQLNEHYESCTMRK